MSRTKVNYRALKPESISDKAWSIIIDAWQNGLSDREAGFRATKETDKRIRESEIKGWKKENPDIAELCEFLQSSLISTAKLNIKERIEAGDIATSKWYLERKAADEFSTKAAVAFEGAAIELSIEEKEKALKDFMKQFGENDVE